MAQYTVEKLIELGAKVVTLSDSNGSIYDEDGITREKLALVMDLKNVRRGRIKEYAEKFPARGLHGDRPAADCNRSGAQGDCAFPSATQNEINGEDAKNLVKNGCKLVAEGANMPTTPDGDRRLPRAQDPLRSGQGRQRRRRGHLGPGDVPEQHASVLDARGSRQPPAP